jgi:membrane protease YdiL (CAAX protease family)
MGMAQRGVAYQFCDVNSAEPRCFSSKCRIQRPRPRGTFLGDNFHGSGFLYQLGFAAVSEEPVFRGFLWGYLRKLGWREIWVWLAQAGLFMSAHLYFRDALPFNFWIVVPSAGLIFGLLAWRTRSIAVGMMSHAAYNGGVYVILLKLILVNLWI